MKIKDLPHLIRERALQCQNEQGNKRNPDLCLYDTRYEGNFIWDKTIDSIVWNEVHNGNYEPFYDFHKRNNTEFYQTHKQEFDKMTNQHAVIDEHIESQDRSKNNTKGNTHYKGDILADLIHDYGLNFNLGNAAKYIFRAGKKDGESKAKDLTKAIDYLRLELKHTEMTEAEKEKLKEILNKF